MKMPSTAGFPRKLLLFALVDAVTASVQVSWQISAEWPQILILNSDF